MIPKTSDCIRNLAVNYFVVQCSTAVLVDNVNSNELS